MSIKYDAETFERAITGALHEGKVDVVVSLLKLMAVHHPLRCEVLLNIIEPTLERLRTRGDPVS